MIKKGDFGVMLALEILTYAKYAAVSHASQALKSHLFNQFLSTALEVTPRQFYKEPIANG